MFLILGLDISCRHSRAERVAGCQRGSGILPILDEEIIHQYRIDCGYVLYRW